MWPSGGGNAIRPRMREQRPRCLVLGLDGLPLSLAKSLALEGDLPNLARLALDPEAAKIEAELPELSPVNWTSFATATGPGQHGIFGFTRIDPASYELSMTDASQVKAPTIFERLTERGLTSTVINLPAAYPVKAIRGTLISGFVAPEMSRAVHPRLLASYLSKQNYLIEADTTRGAADPDHLLAQLRQTLRSREYALDLLWKGGDFDLFVLVLTETDRIMHFFFPALEDPSHPLHAAFMELLALWDGLIGKFLGLYDALPEPKRLLVLADHGFARLRAEVDLNAFLLREGLLRLSPDAKDEWDGRAILPHQSAAFALDPGRVYIHAKERFARGVFHQYVAAGLRAELREKLLALAFEGEKVMEAVYFPEEIYDGPCLRDAPDLICVGAPGFSLTGKFNRTDIFAPPEKYGRFGCHAAHGAIFLDRLDSQDRRDGRETRIERVRDVGAAALDFLGVKTHTPSGHGL